MSTIFPRVKIPGLSALLLGALLLAGCETPPAAPDKPGAYTTSESRIQRAGELAARAAELASPERDRLLLEAANLYNTENRPRRAAAALGRIDESALDDSGELLFDLLHGELALARQDLPAIQEFIAAGENTEQATRQPTDVRVRWHLARGEAFAVTGAAPRSIYELTRAAQLLPDGDEDKQALHNKIWRLVGELPRDQINEGMLQSADPVVAGWYQLGALAREARDDLTLLIQNIQKWRQQYPRHPAAEVPPLPLQQLAELEIINPQKIAVLLPRGGEFEQVTRTLTDGLLASYYERLNLGGEVPELAFYDTNAEPVAAVYQRAVAEGAELVLGPLQREPLGALMNEPELPVPVLGLNYVEDRPNPHGNFYQFGLSIRDEANQIAEQGWSQGHRSAMLILPDSRMGESARDAFVDGWQRKGGEVVAAATYSDAVRDYAELLRPTLLIGQSQERANRLKRLLGKNFDYTPRRRGDVDMVVLVSYPERGRQIKPALDFLYAGDLPVFATSHIYGGNAHAELDQDLDEIVFTAMPWSIPAFAKGGIPPPQGLPVAYKNLFAMGVDAYRLHQWLGLLETLPGNEVRGQTGRLSLVDRNQVQRRLPWARFSNGVPVAAPEIAIAEAGSQ